MKCPILAAGAAVAKGLAMTTNWVGDDCLMAQCAWWEEHFGKCAIAVEAHLKGVADHRLEVRESLRDRH